MASTLRFFKLPIFSSIFCKNWQLFFENEETGSPTRDLFTVLDWIDNARITKEIRLDAVEMDIPYTKENIAKNIPDVLRTIF